MSDEKNTYVAIDYETYYDTKSCYSVAGKCGMTPYQYCHDPRFDAYVMSAAVTEEDYKALGLDGWHKAEFVPTFKDVSEEAGAPKHRDPATLMVWTGRPDRFPWDKVRGSFLVAHNASFDATVTARLQELKVIPYEEPFEWRDTADMVAYFGYQRNLKNACKALLGLDVSKEVRASMDGKTDKDLSDDELVALMDYVSDDAVECMTLWHCYSPEWPWIEQLISEQNRRANYRGVKVNREAVEDGIETLNLVRSEAIQKLPWCNCPNPEDRQKAASIPALAKWLSAKGYRLPKSFNKVSNEFINWKATLDPVKDKEVLDVLEARQRVSGTSPHIARLNTILAQIDERDIQRTNFVYFGAHTGRYTGTVGEEFAGAKSVNLLNLPRKPVYGVDLRAMYVPRENNKFVVFDYSQIEARAILWLVEDHEFCQALFDPKANLYALAAAKMGWCKEGEDIKHKNPSLYQLAKQAVLGLSYGMFYYTFLLRLEVTGIHVDSVPESKWTDADRERLSFTVAKQTNLNWNDPRDKARLGQLVYVARVVEQWRDANWRIAGKRDEETGFRNGGLWRDLMGGLRTAVSRSAKTFNVTLPSGRRKVYFDPRLVASKVPGEKPYLAAATVLNSARTIHTPLTGGKLTENTVQSFCRDIMTYGAVEIEQKFPWAKFCWSCYDEVIFEVPDEHVDEALKAFPEIMCRGDYIKSWTEGLPLAVDGGAFDHYCK